MPDSLKMGLLSSSSLDELSCMLTPVNFLTIVFCIVSFAPVVKIYVS